MATERRLPQCNDNQRRFVAELCANLFDHVEAYKLAFGRDDKNVPRDARQLLKLNHVLCLIADTLGDELPNPMTVGRTDYWPAIQAALAERAAIIGTELAIEQARANRVPKAMVHEQRKAAKDTAKAKNNAKEADGVMRQLLASPPAQEPPPSPGETPVYESAPPAVAQPEYLRLADIQVPGLTKYSKGWLQAILETNISRALTAEPVLTAKGDPTGFYTYQGNVANKSLELIAKLEGHLIDRKQVAISMVSELSDEELQRRRHEVRQALMDEGVTDVQWRDITAGEGQSANQMEGVESGGEQGGTGDFGHGEAGGNRGEQAA